MNIIKLILPIILMVGLYGCDGVVSLNCSGNSSSSGPVICLTSASVSSSSSNSTANSSSSVSSSSSSVSSSSSSVSSVTSSVSSVASSSSSSVSQPSFYSISGSITGLNASGLVIRMNTSNLVIANNATSFKFNTMVANGSTYTVNVVIQPIGETCLAMNNSGTINSADVTNIIISCSANSSGSGSSSSSSSSSSTSSSSQCGLASPAFCDTFDAPATSLSGRSYELDSTRWSLARMAPDLGQPDIIVGNASMLNCRADIPSTNLPPYDTRICDSNSAIQSRFLKTATGAQNYGSNSYRIRQPFDFAGRTGTIAFDADPTTVGLMGWIAIAVTEDPIQSPSFANIPGAGNFETGLIPKNGISIEMTGACLDNPSNTWVTMIHEFRNYVDYDHDFGWGEAPCFSASRYHLNHFELRLSQTKVELWATPYSSDGIHFGALSLVASANVNLGFTRGYVQLIGRNHATLKYWNTQVISPPDMQAAWVASWDNVGFDGPAITNTKEFEVYDSYKPDSRTDSGVTGVENGVDVGYFIDDSTKPITPLTIHNVTGSSTASSAKLTLNLHYWGSWTPATLDWGFKYRVNGKAWHVYTLSMQEVAMYNNGIVFMGSKLGQANGGMQGVFGHVVDVPVSELVDGNNILEIATVNVPFGGYFPTVANIDLILTH